MSKAAPVGVPEVAHTTDAGEVTDGAKVPDTTEVPTRPTGSR